MRPIIRETNNTSQSAIAIVGFVFVFVLVFAIIFVNNKFPINTKEPLSNTTALNTSNILTNNLSIICVTGYSSTVRDVPQKLREEIFARDNVTYALDLPTGSTELDHIVPLCLGGSNDASNLIVQFDPEFHNKDKLEVYLCKHVCTGEININYAQKRIAEDWKSAYKEVYGAD